MNFCLKIPGEVLQSVSYELFRLVAASVQSMSGPQNLVVQLESNWMPE